jgi:hypothetical protein
MLGTAKLDEFPSKAFVAVIDLHPWLGEDLDLVGVALQERRSKNAFGVFWNRCLAIQRELQSDEGLDTVRCVCYC